MLPPALPRLQSPEWDGAVWIGDIDLEQDLPESLVLDGSDGYHRARLLIRRGPDPLGFVELDVVDGAVAADDARRAAMSLAQVPMPVAVPETDRALPPITVVICTRDRVDHLQGALASVSALDYPDFEVVVVDNASPTDATQQYVLGLDDSRVRVVSEPTAGLSRARNTGLRAARHDIVAFTDDDVAVDLSQRVTKAHF